jgi:hypothetical protein
VVSLSWSAATFLAPIAGGTVLQYAGDAALWFGCFGLGLLCAALHLRAGPARERRAAELREPERAAANVRGSERVDLRGATQDPLDHGVSVT